MIAETLVKNPKRAFDYYKKICPAYREEISEIHRCEPYVYAQMIAGKAAEKHGEAKNSWLTGTAAWNYVAVSQYILGIRPGYHGLIIDPVIDSNLGEINIVRYFRGTKFNIKIEPATDETTERTILVDGKKFTGNEIPLTGEEISVIVN
jgi:cellobiose phosphorylase